MAKQLSAEQKTISQIFSEPRVNFLIPDYQRPYSWKREQCETLWNDIKDFAFPNDNCDDFSDSDTYFLGTILTYDNNSSQYEVVDGQQRLVTFLLMLRAFYDAFGKMQDSKAKNILTTLEQCIWNTDKFRNPDKSSLKIIFEVITDGDKAELKKIITTGKTTKGNTSNYAQNYRDFQKWIKEFIDRTPDYFSLLPFRILDNCILLPIKVDSQETALQIFTTLNDRGMPLSDADILKAKFYKFYSDNEEKKKNLFRIGKHWKNFAKKFFIPKKEFPLSKNCSRRTCIISKPKTVPELRVLKACGSFMNKITTSRLPIHNEIVNLYEKKPFEFKGFKFELEIMSTKRKELVFSNQRLITRAMLAWWIFRDEEQELPPIGMKLEIEHIYARSQKENLSDESIVELLGNKSLLESNINIQASDYRFADKKKYYLGQKRNKKKQAGTKVLGVVGKLKVNNTSSK